MIRSYPYTRRVPKKELIYWITELSPSWKTDSQHWKQFSLDTGYWGIFDKTTPKFLDTTLRLREWFSSQCPGIKHKQSASIILHLIRGAVQKHTDNISKSTFLFPIQISKGLVLGVENKEVELKLGRAYRFNDFKEHWMSGKGIGLNMIVTVDFVRGT